LFFLLFSLFLLFFGIIFEAKNLSDSIIFFAETPTQSIKKDSFLTNSLNLFSRSNNEQIFFDTKNELLEKKSFIGVSIDNYVGVQPQAGIQSADIVFETLVEGSNTRLFALYQKSDPYEIVPVRSVRDYFLDISEIFNSYTISAGGNQTALKRVKTKKLPYLNILENPNWIKRVTFFRSVSDRTRSKDAHDALIKPSFLRSILFEKFEFLLPNNPFLFKNEKINPKEFRSEANTEFDITIPFSTISSYTAKYEYIPYLNSYKRILGNSIQTDDLTEKPILVKNIVVLSSVITPRNDAEGHIDIDLKSGGDAYFFLDGGIIKGKWKTGLKFFDKDGNEVFFNKGNIWISIVNSKDFGKIKYNTI